MLTSFEDGVRYMEFTEAVTRSAQAQAGRLSAAVRRDRPEETGGKEGEGRVF